jgi:hypothetical protein
LLCEAEQAGTFLSEAQAFEEALSSSLITNNQNIKLTSLLNQPITSNAINSKDNSCCWSKIMSLQSEFVSKKLLLQMIIEDAGNACLFLPRFHCELNPIELFWSYIKQGMYT